MAGGVRMVRKREIHILVCASFFYHWHSVLWLSASFYFAAFFLLTKILTWLFASKLSNIFWAVISINSFLCCELVFGESELFMQCESLYSFTFYGCNQELRAVVKIFSGLRFLQFWLISELLIFINLLPTTTAKLQFCAQLLAVHLSSKVQIWLWR